MTQLFVDIRVETRSFVLFQYKRWNRYLIILGPVSISHKTIDYKISQNLEAVRFVFKSVRSLQDMTGTSAAVLPMCLSNFKAMQ